MNHATTPLPKLKDHHGSAWIGFIRKHSANYHSLADNAKISKFSIAKGIYNGLESKIFTYPLRNDPYHPRKKKTFCLLVACTQPNDQICNYQSPTDAAPQFPLKLFPSLI